MAYRILARFDDQTIRGHLEEGRNVVGSDPSCDVCLPNPTVSRRHAALTLRGEEVELEDLGSTNGTVVRSKRVDRAILQPGDVFLIGRVMVLLEELPDDDLEVGIGVGRDGGETVAPSAEGRESTAAFSPLDRFTLEHLPKLLDALATASDRHRLAQQVGFALFDTLPVSGVEIVETEGADRGVVYTATRPGVEIEDDEDGWVETFAVGCHVRARFLNPDAGSYYLPILRSAVLMLAQAVPDHSRRRTGEKKERPAERPQPLSVESEVQKIYDQAERVARGDVGVLIFGESGTGKEVLARFVHAASPRAGRSFIAINCASLPRDLLEAELFGVEKGVATGVEARPGKFEAADQGTLFLDEIGDMAQETQAKILRVLQEQEVYRIGGHTPRPARCRILAATNRPIDKMIAEGTFRNDLYHRIATWEVELPPLRRRRGDIPNLAAYFLTREAQRYGIRARGISRAALRALRRSGWPGNIRQLKNEISRAVLFLEDGELLDTGRLSAPIRGEQQARTGSTLSAILEAVEKDEIQSALEACQGDTSLASERLGVSRPTLYRRIKNLDIDLPSFTQH